MNKVGIHLPNGPLADDRVFRLGASHFNMLHYQATEFALRARDTSPNGIIHVRFYLPHWSEKAPALWARECAEEYLQARQYDGREYTLSGIGCHVTPANEMNLQLEGGGSSANWYGMINGWVLEWVREFQALTGCPKERIHFPAFAYGHSDDLPDNGYVGLEICRTAVEACGVLNYHPYWFAPEQVTSEYHGHRFKLGHALFPDKPIFCTEAGCFDVMRYSAPAEMVQWFASLYEFGYVLGGTPFIWEDPTGAHGVNDWSRNRAIADAVEAMHKPEIEEEPAMPDNMQTTSGFDFAFGFKALYDAHPAEIGMATSEQIDIPGVCSVQFTERGVLVWRNGAGVKFIKQTLPNS